MFRTKVEKNGIINVIAIIGAMYVYCAVRAQPVSTIQLIPSPVTFIPPIRRTHLCLYVALNSRTNGRPFGDFQIVMVFRKSEGALHRKVLSPLRLLAARLSPWGPQFDHRSIHVSLVVDKVARGQFFHGVFISSRI
jgi:hypothetical protein